MFDCAVKIFDVNKQKSISKKLKEVISVLVIPKKTDYQKVLGNLESKVAMNLKCGACASCTGGGGGSACKCTGVGKVTKKKP